MAKLGDLVVRVGANTRLLNQGLKQAKRDIQRTTGEIQNLGRSLSMGITAPLALIGASSVKVFADFEQSMAKVKAVSGATNAEFESLTNNAQELGRTTRFTASEVSALQLEFAKLGFTSEEITQVTGATLNLAQATGSDLAQSAEVAGATLRAFGLDASETGHVTDVMAAAFSSSALDINSFQDSMKYVAPVAKAAGVTLEEATAMLGQLANNGIKGSQAGTSLRRILQEVAGTGMDFGEAMKKSAGEVINLADAKDEVGRSASSAFLVLKEGMGDVDGLTTALQNSDGAAADMAATMDDTAEGAMKRMQSAIEGAQIEIGQALAPIMIKLAGIVSDLAARFSSMSDGGQLVIMAISGIAALIGPLLLVIPTLISGINAAKVAFAALNRTMLANPFGLVAAGLTVLVGAIIMLTDETKQAVTAVDALAEANKGLGLEEQKRNIEEQIQKQQEIVDGLKAERDAKQAIVDQGYGGKAIKEANEANAAYTAATSQLDEMNAMLTNVNESLNSNAESTNGAAGETNVLTLEMVKASAEAYKLQQELAKLGTQADELVDKDVNLNEAFFGKGDEDLNIEEFEDIEEEIDDGTDAMIENFESLKEAATNSMLKAAEMSSYFGTQFGGAVANMVNQGVEIKRALQEGLITPLEAMEQKADNAKKAVASLVKDAIVALIQMAKANVIANATSPANAANLLSGGLATPAFIVAGLSMLEGFLGGITAFKDGGIVSGPTLGLVGEYPGASTNPEVIAPLDKLRGMLGGQSVQVTGRLSGRDILLSSEYSAIDRNRVRGF